MTETIERRDASSAVTDRTRIYVNGEWIGPAGNCRTEVPNPATEPLAVVAEGDVTDVDRAVASAREAFPTWSATPPAQRATFLRRTSELLAVRTDELAARMAQDIGTSSPPVTRMAPSCFPMQHAVQNPITLRGAGPAAKSG